MGKKLTLLLGLRQESEGLIGNLGPAASASTRGSFTGQWSPRVGFTFDPKGEGKTKIYYNFGRFHEYIPLDMAERSLSAETGFPSAPTTRLSSPSTAGPPHRHHQRVRHRHPRHRLGALDQRRRGGRERTGGVNISLQDPHSPILEGTKLGYSDEHLVGFEQQLPGNVVVLGPLPQPPDEADRRGRRGRVPRRARPSSARPTSSATSARRSTRAVNPPEFTYNPGDPLPAECDPSLDAGL